MGDRGLDSLSFNGESLLASPKSGELQPERSAFRAVLDAVLTLSLAGVATPNKKPDTIDLSYPWGVSPAFMANKTISSLEVEWSLTPEFSRG